ncbi:MAG: LptF/LptG family permease [Planctomycetes bacterium]|nr:LptF/LptG family permease [Planctomycetota bacterium]MCW8136358.1 LptF/LptG family permease [Planctomycetota bacterium]
MKRFDRYFLWVFIQSFVLVVALFTTVFLVVDVLLNLDKIQAFQDVARGATLFYAFNLPPVLYLLYPFMLVAAGMFAVARLMRSRELLLMEAAGVSRKRALAAVMIPVLLLGFGGLVLRQAVLPQLAQEARESPYGAFEFRKGKRISVRDDQGNVWFVRRYDLDKRSLEGVRILRADGLRLIVAKELTWIDERSTWWAPRTAEVHDLAALTAAENTGDGRPDTFDGDLPYGHLYPADFARRSRSYSDRTLVELMQDSWAARADRELGVNLWHELWHPLTGVILLSCGIGLILTRSGRSVFLSGSLALGAVIGYQIFAFWFETMAKAGLFPPMLGASIPPLLFTGFGAWVYWKT